MLTVWFFSVQEVGSSENVREKKQKMKCYSDSLRRALLIRLCSKERTRCYDLLHVRVSCPEMGVYEEKKREAAISVSVSVQLCELYAVVVVRGVAL